MHSLREDGEKKKKKVIKRRSPSVGQHVPICIRDAPNGSLLAHC